jgi:hypothetical protein
MADWNGWRLMGGVGSRDVWLWRSTEPTRESWSNRAPVMRRTRGAGGVFVWEAVALLVPSLRFRITDDGLVAATDTGDQFTIRCVYLRDGPSDGVVGEDADEDGEGSAGICLHRRSCLSPQHHRRLRLRKFSAGVSCPRRRQRRLRGRGLRGRRFLRGRGRRLHPGGGGGRRVVWRFHRESGGRRRRPGWPGRGGRRGL